MASHHKLAGFHLFFRDNAAHRRGLAGVVELDPGLLQLSLRGRDPIVLHLEFGLVGQGTLGGGLGVAACHLLGMAEGVETRLGHFQVLGAQHALGAEATGTLVVVARLLKVGACLSQGRLRGLAHGHRAEHLAVQRPRQARAPGGGEQRLPLCFALLQLVAVFIVADLKQQVAALYPDVVHHRHTDHHARKLGPYRDDHPVKFGVVGAHVRAGILPALPA